MPTMYNKVSVPPHTGYQPRLPEIHTLLFGREILIFLLRSTVSVSEYQSVEVKEAGNTQNMSTNEKRMNVTGKVYVFPLHPTLFPRVHVVGVSFEVCNNKEIHIIELSGSSLIIILFRET